MKRHLPCLHEDPRSSLVVNDVHSRLNGTTVRHLFRPGSLIELAGIVAAAQRQKAPVSISGGHHAMGGQQFLQHGSLIDMTLLNRAIAFDSEAGTITVEAGMNWIDLLRHLEELQPGGFKWTFAQKQTGADDLTIGGAVSANIHGRGLAFKPFIQDIISLDVITSEGSIVSCSRSMNADLFRLVIGGYGLFALVYAVTLQLIPRRKMERVVEIIDLPQLANAFASRIDNGFIYGDFQFSFDPDSPNFLNKGVFSCYRPVDPGTAIPENQTSLSLARIEYLLHLAHTDKAQVWDVYSKHYLSTNGQVYWSDQHQFSQYPAGYHARLDRKLNADCPGTEMITELYVPRDALPEFMKSVRTLARKNDWNIVYGTIRLIERDEETFLAWAREPWASIIFNLCVHHSDAGLAHARSAFRSLINCAIAFGGSYYLTYHKWATASQIETCYPQIREWLELKRAHDPHEIFRSNWYSFYKAALGQPENIGRDCPCSSQLNLTAP